jgi:predicted MPP superfamily phosphohydrolase
VRRRGFIVIVLIGAFAAVLGAGYRQATVDPIVRSVELESPELAASRPLRILLVSDMHVQRPDMTPDRLARIVRQLDRLHPDLVLLAGDYTGSKLFNSGRVTVEEAVRPLRQFHAPLGVVAVLGNHDRDHAMEVQQALGLVGVRVLVDQAQQIGPVAVGGVFTRPKYTVRRLVRLAGPKIVLAHRPDVIRDVSPLVTLTAAGHTHCGQIDLPFIGPTSTGSSLPRQYICGASRFDGKLLLVTAGLGTSRLPLRYGAPPDVWLIILRPSASDGEPPHAIEPGSSGPP